MVFPGSNSEEKKFVIDCDRIENIHENFYASEELHPKALARRHGRKGSERIIRHGKLLDEYHKLIDRQASLPGFYNFSRIMEERMESLSYHVGFRPRQNLSDVFYKTVAVLSDEDYSRFIAAAKKSSSSGNITEPDGVFITSPLACSLQKRLSEF